MSESKGFKATAATFGLVASKFSIKSLDEGDRKDLTIHAQFNPKDLTIDKSVPWGAPGDAGGGNGNTKQAKGDGGIEMQFTGAQGRTLQVELLFDDVDKDRRSGPDGARGITDLIAGLEELATVRNPKAKDEHLRRPHWCIATWGTALDGFRCVITNIQTKYELFDTAGVPLRAKCTLKLAEAASVSIKDKNPKPTPPTPPAGSGGSSSGGSSPPAGG
jgi:hypothetical protein